MVSQVRWARCPVSKFMNLFDTALQVQVPTVHFTRETLSRDSHIIAWFVFWKQSLFGIVVHRLTFLSCFLQSRQLHSRYGLVPSGHSAVTLATVRSTPFLGLGFSFRRCRALLRLVLLDPSDGKRNTCDIVVSARFLLLIA